MKAFTLVYISPTPFKNKNSLKFLSEKLVFLVETFLFCLALFVFAVDELLLGTKVPGVMLKIKQTLK